jgi:NAD(P)-dependent dehydrogenase (short-subunit alcohol dehydrogenase family)
MATPTTLNPQVIGQAERALGALMNRVLATTGGTFHQWVALTLTTAAGGTIDRTGRHRGQPQRRPQHRPAPWEDTMSDLSGRTTIVVGASRGLGRGIATALAEAGAPVIAVSRTQATFAEPANGAGTLQPELADATDPAVAASLLDRYEPQNVILVAGAPPLMRPLPQQTWETFSVNWHTDVRIAFHWLRQALLAPLRSGSRVVVVSSGAALAGSPLSGGYAGAKATVRFLTAYAQQEATRAGLGITFTALLPKIAPQTGVGRPAVQAYAARGGQSEEEYLQPQGGPLTPQQAGKAVVDLVSGDAHNQDAYLLTAAGLRPLP